VYPHRPIVDGILGGETELLFAGVVEAYGSDRPHPQDWHRDGQALGRGHQLPPHVVNVFIPLVDIDVPIGPTEFWPGTHKEAAYTAIQELQKTRRTPAPQEGDKTVQLLAPAGSAVIFDYRTIHRGGANMTDKNRRVLYCPRPPGAVKRP
jgi:ectoine hydroxylase-related dioxygenase (phytanoyl-CoA dioxygenase family)